MHIHYIYKCVITKLCPKIANANGLVEFFYLVSTLIYILISFGENTEKFICFYNRKINIAIVNRTAPTVRKA